MHILTDAGQAISIACPKDSIFAVQRHIEQMARDCPEITSWQTAAPTQRSVAP